MGSHGIVIAIFGVLLIFEALLTTSLQFHHSHRMIPEIFGTSEALSRACGATKGKGWDDTFCPSKRLVFFLCFFNVFLMNIFFLAKISQTFSPGLGQIDTYSFVFFFCGTPWDWCRQFFSKKMALNISKSTFRVRTEKTPWFIWVFP